MLQSFYALGHNKPNENQYLQLLLHDQKYQLIVCL